MPSRSRLVRISLLLVCTLFVLASAQFMRVHAGEEPATPVVHLPIVSHRLTPVTSTPVPQDTNTPVPTDTPTNTPTVTPTPTLDGTPTSTPTLIAGMVLIEAGPFVMGCAGPEDTECETPEAPRHTVTLRSYAMDPHEVSNSRYATCVDAGDCTPPHDTLAYSYRNGDYYEYYGVEEYKDFPMINVDWDQANAFCAWESKRLPTEAEWEKAARGSEDALIYPWGNTPLDCQHANYNDDIAGNFCVGETAAVESYQDGASPYGILNLSGNVFEWVHDWYDPEYYAVSPLDNPQGPETGTTRVQRGGSLWSDSPYVRVSYRNSFNPAAWSDLIGFRCVTSQ